MKMQKKITDHNQDKCNITPEFNKLTIENVAAILAQTNFVTKTEFDKKLIHLNKKINSKKTKHLLVGNKSKNCKHLI